MEVISPARSEERSQMTQFSPSGMDISENKENLSDHDMEFVSRSKKWTWQDKAFWWMHKK
jgi:hypothetical protein